MKHEKNNESPTPASLKDKQRAIRQGFPENLALRVHRSISWLQRAEREEGDQDAAFIFLWIAFNSAYAEDIPEASPSGERTNFDAFFERILAVDIDHRIYDAIWDRFSRSIRLLLDNQYVFQPFWHFQNGIDGYEDWEDRFAKSRRRIGLALQNRDTRLILTTLFDRLYVLRNQLVHGGATWNSSVNRPQVRDGAAILGFLLPLFIDLMMDNPSIAFGAPYYPVVE
ncbi:hypothetical protein [Parvibaculum sp.]|uniref:hypothetical protein n=1 Tax=Parvibaculum sp. TaxID=2024848 RepID=UPI0032109614